MNSNRKISIVIGVLILTAYSILGTNNSDSKILGMFFEVISGFSVMGIAVLVFPFLKPFGKKISLWYIFLKNIEGILMIGAGILFFIYTPSSLEVRYQIYLVHGYIFALPALMFYYLLYKSKLIPRWLSIWGIIASIILVIVNLLELIEYGCKLEILYLPIVLNEVVLALWLIFKGFNASVINSKEHKKY